jgi:hypothetical protein
MPPPAPPLELVPATPDEPLPELPPAAPAVPPFPAPAAPDTPALPDTEPKTPPFAFEPSVPVSLPQAAVRAASNIQGVIAEAKARMRSQERTLADLRSRHTPGPCYFRSKLYAKTSASGFAPSFQRDRSTKYSLPCT